MTWFAIVLVAILVAAAAFWVLATRAQSVATLDAVDGLFTSGKTELAAGPVAFGPHPQQKLFVHRVPGSGSGESRPEAGAPATPSLTPTSPAIWRLAAT